MPPLNMSNRRPLLCMLIGLTLCVSIWHISTQDAMLIEQPAYAAFTADGNPPPAVAAAAAAANPTHDIAPDRLPEHDRTRLIDLVDFSFIIDQPECDAPSARSDRANSTVGRRLIVAVHSAPANVAKRNVIRETWGRSRQLARIVFMLGAVESDVGQQRILAEQRRHGDLVQGNFVDSYRNLTYKHTMALKWFAYRCPQANYLLKIDDDVFVHTPNAYEFLHDPGTSRRNLLLCKRLARSRIHRSYRSKWRVSASEYRGYFYPECCPGFAIVYSADVVRRLYAEAQRTPYFWIDDVHITGTLAKAIQVPILPFGPLLLDTEVRQRIQSGQDNANDRASFEYCMFSTSCESNTLSNIRQLWARVPNATLRQGE